MKVAACAACLLLLATTASAQQWQPSGSKSYDITTQRGFYLEHGVWPDKECIVASGLEHTASVAVTCRWNPKPGTFRWYWEEMDVRAIIRILQVFANNSEEEP